MDHRLLTEPRPSPIACRMDALSPAERKRRSEVLNSLQQRTIAIVQTTDGLAFHLRSEPDTAVLAGEFVAYESRCCPFVRFELAVEAEGGLVRLSLGGREGVGTFLRQTLMASATRSGTS